MLSVNAAFSAFVFSYWTIKTQIVMHFILLFIFGLLFFISYLVTAFYFIIGDAIWWWQLVFLLSGLFQGMCLRVYLSVRIFHVK